MDLFERIGNFFRRLERYIDVQQTSAMGEILVKVMVEVLSILAIATKEINQSSTSALIRGDGQSFLAHSSPEAFLKKLVGRTDVEDALQRLDKLTQDEVWMATAEGLRTTHGIDNRINVLGNKIIDGAQITFEQSLTPLNVAVIRC